MLKSLLIFLSPRCALGTVCKHDNSKEVGHQIIPIVQMGKLRHTEIR